MTSKITIDGCEIAQFATPYIIAEMSANHNGDIAKAFRLIDTAKKSGADAVKIQTYRPDTITLNSDFPDFQIKDGLWAGRTLYDLYIYLDRSFPDVSTGFDGRNVRLFYSRNAFFMSGPEGYIYLDDGSEIHMRSLDY